MVTLLLGSVHADETTIAVLNFENHSLFNREAYESLSTGLAEMMITASRPSATPIETHDTGDTSTGLIIPVLDII